jgi:hypothetical protein
MFDKFLEIKKFNNPEKIKELKVYKLLEEFFNKNTSDSDRKLITLLLTSNEDISESKIKVLIEGSEKKIQNLDSLLEKIFTSNKYISESKIKVLIKGSEKKIQNLDYLLEKLFFGKCNFSEKTILGLIKGSETEIKDLDSLLEKIFTSGSLYNSNEIKALIEGSEKKSIREETLNLIKDKISFKLIKNTLTIIPSESITLDGSSLLTSQDKNLI